jgi:N6-adenosine-specific RNA methylase IME4
VRPKAPGAKQKQANGSGGASGAFSIPGPESRCALEKLRLHPRSDLVPELGGREYEALLADVRERGMLVPLEVTKKGVVLDGRGRLGVARELGLTEVPIRVVSTEDEVRYLVLAAVIRRALSSSQKAAIVVELEEYEQARLEANKRRLANLKGQTEVATLPPRGRTRDLGAKRAGVCPRTVQDARTVREGNPVLFAAVKAGEIPAHRAAQVVRRERLLAELPAAPPLPEGPYELIYADPPWQLGNPEADYAPENYYPTLAFEEIKALAVPSAADACLFLWAVNSQLRQALDVVEAWGFALKTHFCWVKPAIGLGVWARNRHELLLFGVRGNFSPAQPKDRCDSVIEAPRGRHSEKPVRAYEWIERMYPSASKLELFARGKVRPGWAAWGNEVAE